jgi:hypothetical protein
MTEQEFEDFLAGAYRARSDRPEQPDLASAVLARVQRRRRVRATVLGLATGIGLGVAVVAAAATGLAGVFAELLAKAPREPAMLDPSIVVAVGFALMLAAAARNAIREL